MCAEGLGAGLRPSHSWSSSETPGFLQGHAPHSRGPPTPPHPPLAQPGMGSPGVQPGPATSMSQGADPSGLKRERSGIIRGKQSGDEAGLGMLRESFHAEQLVLSHAANSPSSLIPGLEKVESGNTGARVWGWAQCSEGNQTGLQWKRCSARHMQLLCGPDRPLTSLSSMPLFVK